MIWSTICDFCRKSARFFQCHMAPGRSSRRSNGAVERPVDGAPWRYLPDVSGNWNTVFKRFRHWVKRDVFKRIFDAVAKDPDMQYAMIDATIVKVHRHGQGAKGGLKARP